MRSSTCLRAALAVTAAAMLATSCSPDGESSQAKAEKIAAKPKVVYACSDEPAKGTKAATHIDKCLAPSVGFVEVVDYGAGSGVIVEREGEKYLLTNLHVVDPDPRATIVFPGDEIETIEDVPVLGVDKVADLALLGPIDTERPAVRIEGDEAVKGDEVFLVGYPGETEDEPEPTISGGIVSRKRNDEAFGHSYIQTDATIAGGQSGGALVDKSGSVIGISGLSFAEDFALALSAKDVNDVVERILDDGGDEYWTFPPSDPSVEGRTAGSFDLVGVTDFGSLMVEAAAEPRTIELTVDPADSSSISVTDYQTGESIFMDRAAFEAGVAQMGEGLDPAAIEEMADQSGLVFGDPVAPGRYAVEIPADVDAMVTISLTDLDAGATTVNWTSNIALISQEDDEIDVPLALGEEHEGMLDLMETDATFVVDLEEGATYDVTVASNGGDPGVVLLAPGEAYDDAWSGDDSDVGLYGTDVEEEFTAKASGRYKLIVENYTGSAMAYRLKISEPGD